MEVCEKGIPRSAERVLDDTEGIELVKLLEVKGKKENTTSK